MDGASILSSAILVTALGGAGLAVFLVARTRQAPGAWPLAGFLGLVGLWAVGLLLPDHAGRVLMALAPLAGAVFVHFAVRLSGRVPGRGGGSLILWSYAAGGAATVVALVAGAGQFVPWPGCGRLFRYQGAGLPAAGVTLALAALGHGLLLEAWRKTIGKRRRQILMVTASSALGLGSVLALAFPVVGLEVFPWTLLLLPGYVFMLAYGVVRYELMAANLWARRALTWGLVMALAISAAALPLGWLAAERSWALSALAVAVAMVLWTPVQRLAERLIFPGGEVSAGELASWRAELDAASDGAGIDRIAGTLLGRKLGLPDGHGAGRADRADAPPGPRRVMEMMETLKADARRELERRTAFAGQRRLAELGTLAATVAHDLRNPMNIIAMAVVEAEPATRTEVKGQLARMDALVRDLLDYARPWTVRLEDVDGTAALADAAAGMAVVLEVPPGLTVRADPLRLRQALGNLLTNARSAGSRVLVVAERAGTATLIHVCDDGPGIPEDIRGSLFQPFVSRGSGGTGLGLAIVSRIMAGHGGAVTLGRRDGWATCFTLRFPL